MSDLFLGVESVNRPNIKEGGKIYESLNTATDKTLEKVAVSCRSGYFPGLFIANESEEKYGNKEADLITTNLNLEDLPECDLFKSSLKNIFWHNKFVPNKVENLLLGLGPPDARNMADLPNRVFTGDARRLMEYVYTNGHEERPGKVPFYGWNVDPLFQIESSFWIEPIKFANKLPLTYRKSRLDVKLYRCDVLDSYSGISWIGGLKIERNRVGGISLSLGMNETMDRDGTKMGIIKINMPNFHSNELRIVEQKKNKGMKIPDFNTVLNNVVYNRWVDNGRNTMTRAQIIRPLFNCLGFIMGTN